MTAPRDLAAEARFKADDMRVNLRFDIARLLTELADEIEALREAVHSPHEGLS